MESQSPFAQHFDTNYVPAASEIASIKELLAHRQVVVDGIDGEIAELDRRRKELVEQKQSHTEYIDKHREIISPARRLHPDILLTIFLLLASAPEPRWERPLRADGPVPALVISHVCRQWRDLALRSPLLWTHINICLPPHPIKTNVTVQGPTQDELDRYKARLTGWRQRLATLCARVDLFIERSQGCPLHVLLSAADHRHIQDFLGEEGMIHDECWSDVIQPLLRVKKGDNIWESFRLQIKMSNSVSSLFTFLAFPQVKHEGLRHLELEVAYENAETTREELWEGMEGKIDLLEAPITSLTARMPYLYICRIHARWNRLTSLSIGSPNHNAHFGPQDAIDVLRITPDLVQCTIEFWDDGRQIVDPQQQAVALSKLEDLTICGSAARVRFAALLNTPSLTRLSAMHNTLPAQDENQSAIVEWVRLYGAQLTDVSFRYSALTQPAFALVMENLIAVTTLCLEPREEAPVYINLEIGSGEAPARVETVLDAALLQRLTPNMDGEPGCILPKLKTLTCVLGDGHGEETKGRFIDFIEARRKVAREKGSQLGSLDKVDVTFRVGPVDKMLEDLGRRGVYTDGVTFKARYAEAHLTPCLFKVPIGGIGTISISIDHHSH